MSDKPFQHNRIERSVSRIWTTRNQLNPVIKACREAGYDVVKTSDSVIIGIKETDQIFLKGLMTQGSWLVRFDQKLFDENFE